MVAAEFTVQSQLQYQVEALCNINFDHVKARISISVSVRVFVQNGFKSDFNGTFERLLKIADFSMFLLLPYDVRRKGDDGKCMK